MVKRMLLLASLLVLVSAGSFAQDMMKQSGGMDMSKEKGYTGTVTAVITHEVKEYVSWRKVYDADETNRKAAGMKVSGVYQDAKNPNMVTIIAVFPSAAALEGFVSNPKLKEAMDKGGVISKPDVKVLKPASK